MMPGATSVISSDACSCSCFFGRGALGVCASVCGLGASVGSPGRLDTSVTPSTLLPHPAPPGRPPTALGHGPGLRLATDTALAPPPPAPRRRANQLPGANLG